MLVSPLVLLVLGAGSAATAAACDPVPPRGYVVAVGSARGKQAEATVTALEIARTRLVGQLCDGQSPARCAALKPHIRDWSPTWDQDSSTACAQAAIELSRLDAVGAEAAGLDRDVAALAATVQQGLGALPLWIQIQDTPAARRVAALVQGALAARGGVALAETEAGSGRLVLEADVGKVTTVVAATLAQPGADPRAIGGFTVANDILGVDPGAPSVSAEELTLVVSARKNTDTELRSGDAIRQGDKVTVTASVDQPAFLYLVYDDGGGVDVLLSRDGLYAPAGVPVRLPQPGQVLQVDAEAGKTERLTVIAVRQPLSAELLGSESVASSVRRLRGFDLVDEELPATPAGAAPTWLSDPTPVVSGFGAAVYTLRLEHQ